VGAGTERGSAPLRSSAVSVAIVAGRAAAFVGGVVEVVTMESCGGPLSLARVVTALQRSSPARRSRAGGCRSALGRRAAGFGLIAALPILMGVDPARLAPGAPELVASEERLRALVQASRSIGAATGRLQVAWTARHLGPDGAMLPNAPDPCADPERVEIGWRTERFGAAWREAAQAARAEAARLQSMRIAATVAPLVDGAWAASLDLLVAEAEHQGRAVLEASAWQVTHVRPSLAACPVAQPVTGAGVSMLEAPVRREAQLLVAVLAIGDGWLCDGLGPSNIRAEEAVVLVDGPVCWSASPTCGCAPAAVAPGAVVGPPVDPGESLADPDVARSVP
jgi:hypothetical protein